MFPTRIWLFGAAFVLWLHCSCLFSGAYGQVTHPAEAKALRAIKQKLIDPNRNLSNWNRGDPCVQNWVGVFCYNSTLEDGYRHVKELRLLQMNLSGSLSPELGRLSFMKILDVMWNNISGSIPKEIGNITSLELLLLNGNQLSGPLPEEIGYLPNLDRIQIDENKINGSIPKSFANLYKTQHFHMNNNSISGQIPSELSALPNLVHILLDNNNLEGYLPPELANMPSLQILQLDNNHFDGSTIPATYSNMSHLLKLSLRNCGLQGTIPELSRIPDLTYIDLSSNQLNGSIPSAKLSENITTIDLSNNNLTGTIPDNFSGLPRLQKLSLANNLLNGSIPSNIWQDRTSNRTERLDVDFRNNKLSNISDSGDLPPNVTVRLQGNPICSNTNLVQLCGSQNEYDYNSQSSTNPTVNCHVQSCPPPYEYVPASPEPCYCAAPLLVGYRLKSPGFSDFRPYTKHFTEFLTYGLDLKIHQLNIDSFMWEEGPRLNMFLKIFPEYIDNKTHKFNESELQRIQSKFTGWTISDSDILGPYELLNFTLGLYADVNPSSSKSGISKGALAGIVVGTIAGAVTLSAIVSLLILRSRIGKYRTDSRRHLLSRITVNIDGVRDFTYKEMAEATNNFDHSAEAGEGGYGKVYKGVLVDGTVVAIKRAQERSLQGEKEFLTEIELLSRLHHRNLVSLIGYCDEEGEQMLIYEFMSNGTLRDCLSGKSKEPMNFSMRLRIALGSAKGILYLHTEANPPIFHRDIKATNILLDSKLIAKVADFGLSRLAPIPDIKGIVPDHVSTVVKGTPGYLDPEYFLTRMLTDKSDVYSLGVVFLELLTGMPPISNGKNLVREVNVAYRAGIILSLIDEGMGFYPPECMERFIKLALGCCQEVTDLRPSMAEVVWELESIWLLMPEPNNSSATTESFVTDLGKVIAPPSSSSSSSSVAKNPFVSADVSGSDLVSGVVPAIAPR